MEAIGFIGLGNMGSKMVDRLLKAGHTVIGYNRTQQKALPLIELGMQWAESPREVIKACNITLMSLTDDKAISAIIEGDNGVLSAITKDKLLVDLSTVSPNFSCNIANELAEHHAHLLDAPVSGNPIMIEKGLVTIMVSGNHAEFTRVKPILESISPKIFYVGTNGQALFLKLAINISLAVQMHAFSEGMLLLQKAGVDMNKAIEIIQQSAIASPNIQQRAPYILAPPEHSLFSIKLMQKDLLLALEQGRQLGVPLHNTAITNEALTAACGQHYGDKDLSILFTSIKQMLEK
ncbi:3-hydroxyisobutyrate dehydrogenase [Legionella fallonii LLAP-10]|uniref:3-hydroxyisobutyrate dehydrogenase n=2 Tax=Legionella fallonii TaxID=96230 RepID=A0A098G831_9GAMM|nr:3-hydroxyisobutyrate dehydrogenase [Legionella fallonii LLAP-10]